jgi:cation transport ATPase-like protein
MQVAHEEAGRKLSEVGPNELITVQRISGVKQLLLLFTNPLVIILRGRQPTTQSIKQTAGDYRDPDCHFRPDYSVYAACRTAKIRILARALRSLPCSYDYRLFTAR